MDKLIIQHLYFSSFKGCFLGGLLGDVLGRPFEGQPALNPAIVQKYFKTTTTSEESPTSTKRYSDDTLMTMDLSRSLIECKGFDAINMAKRFAKSCISSFIDRYYGAAVTTIFEKWMVTDFKDVWVPAKEQFKGSGSFGNGAAMRISPIGLLASISQNRSSFYEQMELAIKTSQLTHTHPHGVGGAIFQTVVISRVVQTRIEITKNSEMNGEVLWMKILNAVEVDLIHLKDNYDKDPKSLEQCEFRPMVELEQSISPYLDKIGIIRDILKEASISKMDFSSIGTQLGNGVAAIDSVPTALFCFLAAFHDIPDIRTDSHFQRAVQLAINLGGDADTIASMTGSICGAFLGFDEIPKDLQRNSEGVQDVLQLAEMFFEAFYMQSNPAPSKF